jgi:uncharacterized protein
LGTCDSPLHLSERRREPLVTEQGLGQFAPQIRQDEQEVTHIAYGIEPMRLIANSTPGLVIRAYTDEAITIQFAGTKSNEDSEDTFTQAVLLHPEGAIALGALEPSELSEVLCEPIWPRSPELVIIGHCQSDLWLSAEQRALFLSRGVGLEVMKLGAACRTYNLLTADGRSVVALLFPK